MKPRRQMYLLHGRRRVFCNLSSSLSSSTSTSPPAFSIGIPPFPALFLFLFLLPGIIPPAAAQPALSLEPSGVLVRMGHIVPTEVYFDSPETDGLNGVRDVVASGDLLFVTASVDDTLSVWRVNAEAGTLSQTVLYRDNTNGINGLDGAAGVAVSDDGKLLFVAGRDDDALSVWRVNEAAESLEQIEVYLDDGRDGVEGIDGLAGANDIAVSGNLLFVTARDDNALSAWQVDAAAGTLRRTALHRNQNDLGLGLDNVAVSDNLVFVTGTLSNSLSVWQVNAEVGTLMPTGFYRRLDSGDPSTGPGGLFGAWGVAASGDGNLLFVTGIDEDTLGVWRVNAEAGTLTQTVFYRDSGLANAVDGILVDGGLFFPRGVAVSGNLLFVTGQLSEAISAWQINAEAGTLRLASLYQDIGVPGDIRVAEADGQIDGLEGAWNVAVSDGLLFVTTFDVSGTTGRALSVWHINNAEVSMETPTVISMQLDLPVDREVMVTVTAQSGAEMVRANPVTLSPGTLSGRAVFPPGALGLGRWIFTAQANLPTVLDTGAAQTAVQVVPLLFLESRQGYAVGSPITLTVRASPALQVAASYRIIARRIGPPSVPEVDLAVTYPAGSTEVTVLIPAQSMGQWEFSIQLPDGSPFRAGDSVTAFISTPALSLLQPEGMLTRMKHAALRDVVQLPRRASGFVVSGDFLFITEFSLNTLSVLRVNRASGSLSRIVVYRGGGGNEDDAGQSIRLRGPVRIAARGNLLFVTEINGNALRVWRVNRASGRLTQGAVYRDGGMDDVGNMISGLELAQAVEVSGNLLFVTGRGDAALSVWRINAEAGTLSQTAVYRDSVFGGLSGALNMAVSDNLLFVGRFVGDLSAWRINAEAGTLSRTDLHQDGVNNIDGLSGMRDVAVSSDGDLLFVTAIEDNALSVWRINAEEGTLSQAELYRDGVSGIDGLGDAQSVAASGDLLFTGAREGNGILSIWRINAEAQAGILGQIALQRGGVLSEILKIEVSGDVLFVSTEQDSGAISAWHINNAEVPFGPPVMIRVQSDIPVLREVVVTITARNGAEEAEAAATLSPDGQSVEATFRSLSPGRWIFTAQAEPPALLNIPTGAARIAMQVLAPVRLTLDVPGNVTVSDDILMVTVGVAAEMPLPEGVSVTATLRFSAGDGEEIGMDEVVLTRGQSVITVPFTVPSTVGRYTVAARGIRSDSILLPVIGASAQVTVQPVPVFLESRQEQFAAGNTVTLTVRVSAALRVAASYRIIARRIGPPSVPEVDFAFTHPAGSTEVTVPIPGQSLSTGQWEFSIQLPGGSPFQVGDSVTAFISTPALSLQPQGMLSMMEHAVLTEVYSDSTTTDGLQGVGGVAVSGDGELLFVVGTDEDALSVWRVNAERGILRQNVLYRDGNPDNAGRAIDSLFRPSDVEVSDDLLFVASPAGNKLSVWRVSKQTGTLRRIVTYKSGSPNPDDPTNRLIFSLSGVRDVTVSGDGNLLFVTAVNFLSVWRVNASSGTLRESRAYVNLTFDDEERLIRSLGGVLATAISDDDELLFVTADADNIADDNILSVWRVNASSGTLRQTAFYKNFGLDDEDRTIRGLAEARDVAVSGDLLFVPAFRENALSVWRVNASSGTLRQTALYQDIRAPGATTIAKVDGRVDGLNGAAGVALSDDGSVLFVTALQDDTLSVWQVNASSGTLRQTALYRNNEAGVTGLDGAGSVTVSGDLLFVTVQSDNALSVWQINNAEVPFGVPVMLKVQSDIPVVGEVMVTVTARNGAEMARDTVTLSPENLSAEARFAPGTLGPGRWIFTAQAQPPALLDTGAARIAMQVRAPVELTLDVSDSVTVGNTFTVTVGVPAETPLPEGVSVTATLSFSAGDGEEIEGVVLTSARSSAQATFTAPDTADRYTVAVTGADGASLLLLVVTTAQVTVQPVLALDVPSAPIYRGVVFPVRVRLLGGLLEDNGSVVVTVYLRNAVTHALASTATAILSTAAPSDELSFEAPPGEAAVTAYILTTEDIDQAGLAPLTRAVLSLQSAPPATVFITRINADLSGNRAFDVDDAVLIVRGILTQNYLARSAGGLSPLGPGALQARLSELADFADISGDGGLDIIDLIFLTRNPDATVSDLQSRVNADDNPFAYLCGDSGSDACEDISSPHQNITEGIRYEAIGEVLDDLRRVPQPPILSPPNNP